VSVSFAPDEEPHRIVGSLIDAAQDSVYVAMFTAKDVEYEENGQPTSLLRKLIAANDRGVDVRIIVDHGIHEASEYYGIETDDDPIDEWLEDAGVHVVRADNPFGQYASMHHKLLTIDGRIAVTGAFNWYYDAAYRNDEDQLVWRDETIARRFVGEMVDLLRRYDDDYDPSEWPSVQVDITARNDRTEWGEGVTLVGDVDVLGAWLPAEGIALDPIGWPLWSGSVELPIGTRIEYKLATTERSAVSWEPGENRVFTVPTDGDVAALELEYR
jgi:phosphatidylserine/phosphatidylglycerophosphate/cardiolipin synthase-like enzyme